MGAQRSDFNSHDWQRVEAVLNDYVDELDRMNPRDYNPKGKLAMERTLDKVQRINSTGPYTPQRM